MDAAMLAISAQIEARFMQQKALTATNRGTVSQQASVWQDGKTASMALIWQGEQASGSDDCTALGLNVSLETGEEILMEQLFADWDGALEAMETIIADDVLENMSDYMEYSELLPMPTDNYAFDECGLTVYWPEDEIANYIGEESPAYALAHPDVSHNAGAIEEASRGSGLGTCNQLKLGELLGRIGGWYPLADPDYTTDALVFPLERERGYAVEIPKYAETEEDETPVSAIRASNISIDGLLTTGKTTREEIIALLGEPAQEIVFDGDAAFDAMLEPGRSLYYRLASILQLHVDEDGVLSCVILRDAMPESLY